MKKLLYILLVVCSVLNAQTPGAKQTKSMLLKGGIAHLGNGSKIELSAIGFEDGKITIVTDLATGKVDESKFDTIIDITGKHIYPGFIVPNSIIGITEIEAVRATNDFREVGNYKPHVRSLIAYNTESIITSTVRTNGVLIGQITPRGGAISGTSSVVHFDAWNWEDAVINEDDGVHVNWPRRFKRSWGHGASGMKKSEKYEQQKLDLRKFFDEAKAYQASSKTPTNLRYAAMDNVFTGKSKLFVHVNGAKEILEAVHFANELGIKGLVIVGGKEAGKVASTLKANNVSVVLNRIHDLPSLPHSDVNEMYKTPALLAKEGVMFCFNYEGDMGAMGARNLPFSAGTAVAHGLDYEKAIQALTLDAAKILGIDSDFGSLEVGKDATLFISEGDALDMRSNDVVSAFINGRVLELTNHQIELYEKYSKKLGIEVK